MIAALYGTLIKLMTNVIIENYVVVNNELIKIVPEIISLSKNLKELSELRNKVGDKNE